MVPEQVNIFYILLKNSSYNAFLHVSMYNLGDVGSSVVSTKGFTLRVECIIINTVFSGVVAPEFVISFTRPSVGLW